MSEVLELIFYTHHLPTLSVRITVEGYRSVAVVYGLVIWQKKYELSKYEICRISMIRIMVPNILIAVGVGMFSFVSSNYLKTGQIGQFKNDSHKHTKGRIRVLAFEEGIFNDFSMNNHSVSIVLPRDQRDINNILIHDHTPQYTKFDSVMLLQKLERCIMLKRQNTSSWSWTQAYNIRK